MARKRKLTPKQIRAGFGGKRRKVAARKRHRPATKKRSNPHRTKKRATARKSSHRHRTKKRAVARRRNPVAEIISWTAGNPARKKGKKSMAHKPKKRASARHSNAGRSHKRHMTRRRRHNPAGLGRPMDWVQGGLGVLGGVVGTRALPQLVLGASNTGPMGYAANGVAALALGWGAHMLFKKPIITTAVIAGGFASLFSRIISDQTPFGAQLSLSGLGDWGLGLYQKSNFPYPPRVSNGRGPGTSMFNWGDGSQGLPAATFSSGGSDSTGAC